MSHVISLASVVFLTISIILGIVGITSTWWTVDSASEGGAKLNSDVTLWEMTIDVSMGGSKAEAQTSWDDMCDSPGAGSAMKDGCAKVKAARAFLIIGTTFAFLAACGNAGGIYTGNTLIDSAAGVVAAFGVLFHGLGMGMAYMTDAESGLTDSVGWTMAAAACGAQLTGAVCGCIGTCQEMHDMAMLAASLHLGAYKDAEKTSARSEKSAKLREVEAGEAAEMYNNLQKRKKAAEAALKSSTVTDPSSPAADGDDGTIQKVPVMLKRVLFRKPAEGDDDEIPTRMLEDAFAEIDGDGSGSIELDELVDALKLCGLAVSANATSIVMKEIDKNMSGDVDLREFIEFFRHIEDLNRFSKKTAARQQFCNFLLNFCFLADMVVVGAMLMMFIRMKEEDNPDNYSIMKNVLMACGFLLGVLFLLVILMPILRLALGPTATKMQQQYELAQEIKKSQRKKAEQEENSNDAGGPRQLGYSADDPPPPVNAAMFGRSYRPGKVDSTAWTPAIEDLPPLNVPGNDAVVVAAGNRTSSGSGSHDNGRGGTKQTAASGQAHSRVSVHGHGGHWRYDPSNYAIATDHANMLDMAGLGPTSWTPMQVRDATIPKTSGNLPGSNNLPGAPPALTDAAFPQPQGHNAR